MKILLVEDDEFIALTLLRGLSSHRFLINTAVSGQSGLELAKSFKYDIILLDVLLPDLDGLNLCRQLRAQGCQTPILMLSAKGNSSDRVLGLESGADDYLVKPFELSEVVARIQALLRRGRSTAPEVLCWGDLRLSNHAQDVTVKDQHVHLTPKEFGLVELFLRNPQQLFTRSAILDHLWALDKCPAEEAVNTHIKVLRQKLTAAGLTTSLIQTVYGLGYRLALPPSPLADAELHLSSHVPHADRGNMANRSKVNGAGQGAEAKVAASIAQVWDGFKVHWLNQLRLLHQLSAQWTAHAVDPQLLEQAIAVTHRLVGALGTFGRPEGTQVARQIETILTANAKPDAETAFELSKLVERLQEIVESPSPILMPAATSLAQTRGKIIVVDDDLQILLALPKILEPLGFEVVSLSEPQKIWETLEQSMPSLVILDIEMPALTGLDLCQMIRHNRRWSDLPILFLTAHPPHQSQNLAFQAGADDYVTKPIVASELTTRVLNRLERVRQLQSEARH